MVFKDYFQDQIEYPTDNLIDGEILPDGILHKYISTTFLNGFINYVKPIKAFVISRYFDEHSKIKVSLRKKDPISFWEYHNFDTKPQLVDKLNDSYEVYHTDLSMFNDDVLMLCESEDYYYYFWFDMDCSDSCIGRFKKTDQMKNIVKEFEDYCIEINKDYSSNEMIEFKLEWIKGHIHG